MKTPTSDLLCALRRRSGLSWDETAALLGVSRRDVHHWASGGAVSLPNECEARIRAWYDVVAGVDAPADAVRAALLREDGTFASPDELVRVAGGSRRAPEPGPLSEAAQAARRPPPPAERIIEELDSPHPVTSGRTRRFRRK